MKNQPRVGPVFIDLVTGVKGNDDSKFPFGLGKRHTKCFLEHWG